MTIHQFAIQRLEIAKAFRSPAKNGGTARQKMLTECARAAVHESAKYETHHLNRDYRPGIGSGRRSDWFITGFEHLSVLARTVHREMGYSGPVCREIAHTLHKLQGGWDGIHVENERISFLPSCRVDPVYWADCGFAETHCRQMAGARSNCGDNLAGEHVTRWRLWLQWHGRKAIGEYDARKKIASATSDPAYRVSGYLADSIQSWKQGKHGYEMCSGCEYIGWLKSHPEYWDVLMSRAPRGASGDGWEHCFPHEHDRAELCRAAGWHQTMRLNDSIWSRKRPLTGRN